MEHLGKVGISKFQKSLSGPNILSRESEIKVTSAPYLLKPDFLLEALRRLVTKTRNLKNSFLNQL